jgi:hypothetical protein
MLIETEEIGTEIGKESVIIEIGTETNGTTETEVMVYKIRTGDDSDFRGYCRQSNWEALSYLKFIVLNMAFCIANGVDRDTRLLEGGQCSEARRIIYECSRHDSASTIYISH